MSTAHDRGGVESSGSLRRERRRSGLRCAWSRRRLSLEADVRADRVSPGWLDRLASGHVASCVACQELVVGLNALEQALDGERTAAIARHGELPGELRSRVADEYRRAQQDRIGADHARSTRRGSLERLTLATGSVAVVALLAVVVWSRRADFGPVPRTVHIELPADCELVREPSIIIRRASGIEEVQ